MRTPATQARSVVFDVDKLSDEALAELRRLSYDFADEAPLFMRWLHHWLDHVQACRAKGEHIGPRKVEGGTQIDRYVLALAVPVHKLGDVPRGEEWPARELAAGWKVAQGLSYAGREPAIGELGDRLCMYFADMVEVALMPEGTKPDGEHNVE